MANHPYNQHREHQVAHRRVDTILKAEPAGAKKHFAGNAFSKMTSKTAAVDHNGIEGSSSPKRYARGGKVKHGSQTNIAIVLPGGRQAGASAGPMPGPGGGAPPMAGPPPGGPPMGGPPGMPPGMPPGLPPGLPRARGGRANYIEGTDTKANQRKWSDRAEANSFFRGGAASGVGREEKAAHMKRKGK